MPQHKTIVSLQHMLDHALEAVAMTHCGALFVAAGRKQEISEGQMTNGEGGRWRP